MRGTGSLLARVRRTAALVEDCRSLSIKRGPARSPDASKALARQEPLAPSDVWTPVVDKATRLTYYWQESSGRTTALGELPPGNAPQAPPPTSFAASMVQMVAYGAGVSLAFAAVRAIF